MKKSIFVVLFFTCLKQNLCGLTPTRLLSSLKFAPSYALSSAAFVKSTDFAYANIEGYCKQKYAFNWLLFVDVGDILRHDFKISRHDLCDFVSTIISGINNENHDLKTFATLWICDCFYDLSSNEHLSYKNQIQKHPLYVEIMKNDSEIKTEFNLFLEEVFKKLLVEYPYFNSRS